MSIWGLQAALEEDLGCPGPAEVIWELIYYTQFHDEPDESQDSPDDKWYHAVADDDAQVCRLSALCRGKGSLRT